MKKTVFLLFALLMVAGSNMGQTLKTYSGLYEGGKATYTYYEDENGERVKHGKFTYDKGMEGTGVGVGAISGRMMSFTTTHHASGNYKNNMKDGEWIYKRQTNSGGHIFGAFSAVINYAEGNMQGLLNSESVGYRFQMKNNRITGPVTKTVKRKNENWSISGQFDDDGFPDGTWTKKYELDGNLYVNTEKYVHGLLISSQIKNESTGEITRRKFDIDPQQFLDAQNSGNNSTVVDKFICKEEIYFKQGEHNYSNTSEEWLPEIFGSAVIDIIDEIKKESAYASGQNTYQGIPFKKIVVIDKITAPDEGEPFDMVEQMPRFPGGDEEMNKYLQKNLNYPPLAKQQGTQGRVIVQFVVNTDGSISDAQVVRKLDPSCDEEALRLINSMPRWIPGKQAGKYVRVKYTVSITFRLQ